MIVTWSLRHLPQGTRLWPLATKHTTIPCACHWTVPESLDQPTGGRGV
jgi:hypothetical protein